MQVLNNYEIIVMRNLYFLGKKSCFPTQQNTGGKHNTDTTF